MSSDKQTNRIKQLISHAIKAASTIAQPSCSGLRSTGDVVDQLEKQIELLQFTVAEQKRQLDGLSRELLKARLELALGAAPPELARPVLDQNDGPSAREVDIGNTASKPLPPVP